jgi:hypothetical protein
VKLLLTITASVCAFLLVWALSLKGKEDLNSIDSNLQVETSGQIKQILLLGKGPTEFFLSNSNKYGPCILDPIMYEGTFLTDIAIFTSSGDSLTLQKDSRWVSEIGELSEEVRRIFAGNRDIPDEAWSSWIRANRPFTQDFSIIEFRNDTVDLWSMSEEERASLIIDLERAVAPPRPKIFDQQIVWESDGEAGLVAEMIIRKRNKSKFGKDFQAELRDIDGSVSITDRVLLLEADLEFERLVVPKIDKLITNMTGKSTRSSYFPLYVGADKICYCDYYGPTRCNRSCTGEVFGELGRYFQDRFHIRESTDGVGLNTARAGSLFNSNTVCHFTQEWSEYFQNFSCAGGSSADSMCSIAGGNMFVTEDVLFIGKDEFYRIWYSENMKASLGIKVTNQKSIENALLRKAYSNPAAKKLIWVGTNDLKEVHSTNSIEAGSRMFQPIYHIDLFFNPLGTLSPGSKSFYFLLGVPEETKQIVLNSKIDHLDTALNEIRSNVSQALIDAGYVPKCIEVPLGVKYENEFYVNRFTSFCNGLFEKWDGHVNFLMPRYDSALFIPYSQDYVDIELLAIENMNNALDSATNNQFEVIPVYSSTYNFNSALRCQVKVIRRE